MRRGGVAPREEADDGLSLIRTEGNIPSLVTTYDDESSAYLALIDAVSSTERELFTKYGLNCKTVKHSKCADIMSGREGGKISFTIL